MITITKEEAMGLKAKYGDDIDITITGRHKKSGRKRYYTEETRRVFLFLERFHNKNSKNQNKRKREAYT